MKLRDLFGDVCHGDQRTEPCGTNIRDQDHCQLTNCWYADWKEFSNLKAIMKKIWALIKG